MNDYQTHDPINNLVNDLTRLYEQSRAESDRETDPEKKTVKEAYACGIKDALNRVRHHLALADTNKDDLPDALPLHQMPAAEVLRILRDTPETLENCSLKDLQEAAFRFENELMACLGDLNTIFFDTYEALDRQDLIPIITRSLEDISRVSGE